MTPTDGFLPPASSERKSADRRERLRVLLHTLGERRWLILATAAVIVAIATLNSAAQDDKYEAVSKVLVGQTDPVNGLFPGAGADSDPDRVARTNLELIENATVAERVERALAGEVDLDSEQLLDRVDADIENDSDVVAIKVRDEDPEQAAAIANAFAVQFARFRERAASRNLETAIERAQLELDSLEGDELTSPRGRTIERRLSDLEIAAALQGSSVEVVKRADAPDDPVEPQPVRRVPRIDSDRAARRPPARPARVLPRPPPQARGAGRGHHADAGRRLDPAPVRAARAPPRAAAASGPTRSRPSRTAGSPPTCASSTSTARSRPCS